MTDSTGIPTTHSSGRWRSILLLCVAEIMAMSTWFSTSSVMAQWKQEFALSNVWAGVIASSTSAGFVVGAVALAVTGVPDRYDGRRIFALAALIGAAANAASLIVDPGSIATTTLRLIVGASAAGIYPIGMRLASTWAKADLGFLVGLLVGAQVIGLSLPYLVDVMGGLDWRVTIAVTSLASLGAAALIGVTRTGPNFVVNGTFHFRTLRTLWKDRAIRLVNIGYLGHMWELFALWGWIAVFLQLVLAGEGAAVAHEGAAKTLTFLCIAAGALGCISAGRVADRCGRYFAILLCQVVSASCALSLVFFAAMPAWLVVGVCLLWGFIVVADSAQFSAAIVDLSPPGTAGSMLVVQVALGYLLTTVSLQVVPIVLDAFGWSLVFVLLTGGPAVTICAVWRLRERQDRDG